MKIQGDAETSARTGIPTYNVREDDRQVTWTINLHALIRFAEWDQLPANVRALQITNWRNGDPNSGVPEGAIRPDGISEEDVKLRGWRATADMSMLEQHAIVARNSLRNFLGYETGPGISWTEPATAGGKVLKPIDRRLHLYKGPAAGWLGWIEVNGRVEAWVTLEGEVIEDARINYGQGPGDHSMPISYTDVDGRGFSHATAQPI